MCDVRARRYGSIWSYGTVFGNAMTSHVPLPMYAEYCVESIARDVGLPTAGLTTATRATQRLLMLHRNARTCAWPPHASPPPYN